MLFHQRALTTTTRRTISWLFVAVVLPIVVCIGCHEEPTDIDGNASNKQATIPPTDTEPPIIEPLLKTPGHDRMLKRLEAIVREVPDQDQYFGIRQLNHLQATLKNLPDEPGAGEYSELLYRLSQEELRLGREQAAIDHLSQAYEILQRIKANFNPNVVNYVTYQMGVSYLRLAETQNCCQRNTPDSCQLPIQGEGIHQNPEGSRKAIYYFTKLLRETPADASLHIRGQWLLNIAYMTLGQYPHQVPQEYLVAPEQFAPSQSFPAFRNISKILGLDTFSESGGVVVDDFDNDGRFDILVSSYHPAAQLRFFHNQTDSESIRFVDRTQEAGLDGITGGLNMVQADFDNDGLVDVFVLRGAWLGATGRHPNSLLRNIGTPGRPRFTDVTYGCGLGDVDFPTQTASWSDFDNDGDLDLYIGNETSRDIDAPCQLFRNDGDRFTDVASVAGVTNDRFTKAVHWGDFNNDGWPDLYVSNLGEANRLYENLKDGTFRDQASQLGVAEPLNSFPSWFWDYDNDGDLDILATAYEAQVLHVASEALGRSVNVEPLRLYRNDGPQGFLDVAREAGLSGAYAPMGSNFGDIDGDGRLDFYLGTGWPDYDQIMPNVLLQNQPDGSFANVTYAARLGHLQKGHAVAFADLDGDGDQDVFQQMGGAFPGDKYFDALYENPGFGNHWISLQLIGTKTNRSAIGAQIRVDVIENGVNRSIFRRVNSGGSFGANPLTQPIGIGKATQIDRLEVYWPTSQQTQVFERVPANQRVQIVEGKSTLRTLDTQF
ncbi:MAG: hypothetical protein CMJ80_04405 [Planctomycetaceae bacterium]|nr:hypothetical protein [Planctomycetaceae bacterium]